LPLIVPRKLTCPVWTQSSPAVFVATMCEPVCTMETVSWCAIPIGQVYWSDVHRPESSVDLALLPQPAKSAAPTATSTASEIDDHADRPCVRLAVATRVATTGNRTQESWIAADQDESVLG
jgi:hypothetical protein